ncbi:sigma-70 family RNA polymerase sigma factor [Clostridium tetani]|uniref:sigma-70 family RNA polymerase sigma factor n=1 Tax=Clostridium tetani TaxID=1513 RepID=UPI00100B4ED8|nr:sigma-70 family RNA polymerase sigma factor [Clostridium tetani]RXM74499.1 RNA polymerase subunit sigma-70 [Clostridium tetani]
MHIDRNNFLDEIRKGNTKALDYIMETYSPLVKGIVTKVLYTLGDNGLVEECIADVFISVWKNNVSFTGDGLSFKKWIACISKYKAIDYYRKNKNNLEMYDIDECIEKSSYDLEEEIIDLENEDKLLKLINKLEETNRSIFIMKFFLGMSSSEIGKKLNLSSNAVDNRIFRERKKLRNKFYKNEKEEILYENNI